MNVVILISFLIFCMAMITICVLALCRVAAEADEPSQAEAVREPEFAADYLRTFEPMRRATANAHRETSPGAPSSDLDTCKAIWPDAPHMTGEDGTS